MDEFKTVASALQTTGVIGALIFFIVGLVRGWWFMKSYVDDLKDQLSEMRKDRNEWKSAALRGTSIAERSIDTVADAVGQRRLEARMLALEAEIHMGGETTT